MSDETRQVRVECGDVTLKLTLNAKMLKKPLVNSVLAPFLKAYSKKMELDPPVGTDRLQSVHVEQDRLVEWDIPASVVLKANDITDIQVALKTAKQATDKDEDEAAAEPPPGQKLVVGQWVEVHGLTSEAGQALNGLGGKVKEFHLEKQRYDVALDGEGRVISVRFENLKILGDDVSKLPIGGTVAVHGLTSESSRVLNGKLGRIISFNYAKGRYMLELQNIRNRKNIKPANLRRLGAIEMLEFVEARTKTTLKECKSIRAKLEDEYRSAMALDVFGRIAARVDVVVKHSKQLKVDMAELDLMLENPDLILKDEQRATALRKAKAARDVLETSIIPKCDEFEDEYARQNMNGEELYKHNGYDQLPADHPVNRSINDMWKEVMEKVPEGTGQEEAAADKKKNPLKAESSEDDSDYEDLGEWYDKESPKYKPKVLPKDGKTWQEAQDEQDALDAISAEDLS